MKSLTTFAITMVVLSTGSVRSRCFAEHGCRDQLRDRQKVEESMLEAEHDRQRDALKHDVTRQRAELDLWHSQERDRLRRQYDLARHQPHADIAAAAHCYVHSLRDLEKSYREKRVALDNHYSMQRKAIDHRFDELEDAMEDRHDTEEAMHDPMRSPWGHRAQARPAPVLIAPMVTWRPEGHENRSSHCDHCQSGCSRCQGHQTKSSSRTYMQFGLGNGMRIAFGW